MLRNILEIRNPLYQQGLIITKDWDGKHVNACESLKVNRQAKFLEDDCVRACVCVCITYEQNPYHPHLEQKKGFPQIYLSKCYSRLTLSAWQRWAGGVVVRFLNKILRQMYLCQRCRHGLMQDFDKGIQLFAHKGAPIFFPWLCTHSHTRYFPVHTTYVYLPAHRDLHINSLPLPIPIGENKQQQQLHTSKSNF